MGAEASTPFELFLGVACGQYHLVELVIAYEHNLPRVWRGVALETPAIVHVLHLHIIQSNAGLDCVYLIKLSRRSEAEPVPVQEGNHILSVDTLLGLPADM